MKKELIDTIKEFQEVMQFEPSLTESYELENLDEKELENIIKKASTYIDWEIDEFSENTLIILSKLKILQEANEKGFLRKEWKKYLNIDNNFVNLKTEESNKEIKENKKVKKGKEKTKIPILELISKSYCPGISREEWTRKSYELLKEYGYSEDKKSSIDRWFIEIYMIAKYLNLKL